MAKLTGMEKDIQELRKMVRKKELEKENLDDLIRERDVLRAKGEIAERMDIEERFKEYETDKSVGGMYQQKARRKKAMKAVNINAMIERANKYLGGR